MTETLLGPEADEIGIGQDTHRRGRDEVETVCLLEHAHEMAQVAGFAGARRAFENGESVVVLTKTGDEAFMPLNMATAVVKAEGLIVEQGFDIQRHDFGADFATSPDQAK
jgi:hypothetical protein